MLGNILIDKLRFNIPENNVIETGYSIPEYITFVKNVLSKYFYKSAFSVSNRYHEIKITLTPTRYTSDFNKTKDFNLEMSSEDWLYNLFSELGLYEIQNRRLYEAYKIVELHLIKNLITKEKPSVYMDFLLSRSFRYGFKAEIIESNATNKTLSIARHKINNEASNTVGDRQFIFYDKAQQILNKTGMKYIQLKEHLTENEINQLPKNTYSKNDQKLHIENLNMLRCELQYSNSNKLNKLENFILGTKDKTTLKLSTLLDLLEQRRLYSKLNEYYVSELKKYVFYTLPEKDKKLPNAWKGLFVDLISGENINYLTALYNDCTMGDIFKRNLATAQEFNTVNHYLELYYKLGFGWWVAKNKYISF